MSRPLYEDIDARHYLMQLAAAGQSKGAAGTAASAVFDEMCSSNAQTQAQKTCELRPVWAEFADWLGEVPLEATLDRRAAAVAKQIITNGITYNVYSDTPQSPARPWSLDLLPLLISGEDWAQISQGVLERAELMNRMMQDIYGDQTLLKDNLLPPALVFGNPGYLRPMHGYKPPSDCWLHLMAFDLARASDGKWWVIGHRVQAPSGLGYVLENRLTIARALPEAFREMKVQHVASFYKDYLESIRTLSPAGQSARVALLTPGPYNETYFEHAYLARYLGITLVESHDLIVREGKVFLKTVHGLERIDAILRRVDDDWVDPLELRADSHLGVPGLLQAIRSGEVIVANTPGGGWLESPALHGFLPGISEAFMGKALTLPSVPSWWCGEAPAWAQVAGRMDHLVIKATAPSLLSTQMDAVLGIDLDETAQRQWRARISKLPEAYTLQELLPLSQMPVWKNGEMARRSLMLRVYAATDGKGGYHVLPGGLTRVSGNDSQVVSMQRGGSSVDTWVITDGAVDRTTLLTGRLNAQQVRARQRPVSSTAAEHLFWLGRYSERAECQLRLVRHVLKLLREDEALERSTLEFTANLCTSQGLLYRPNDGFELNADVLEIALLAGLGDIAGYKTGTASVGFNMAQLSRVASQIRDRLSTEHWRWVTECDQVFRSTSASLDREEALERLSRLRRLISAISGEQSDHMTRDDGWRFLTIGRQLERLINASEVLLTLLKDPRYNQETALELFVAQGDSVITYRARYQHRFEWLPCMDLMVFDESNPRSLLRIIYKIRQAIEKLPGDVSSFVSKIEALEDPPVGISLEELEPPYGIHTVIALKTWLQTLQQMAYSLSDSIGSRYFRLAEPKDQLT